MENYKGCLGAKCRSPATGCNWPLGWCLDTLDNKIYRSGWSNPPKATEAVLQLYPEGGLKALRMPSTAIFHFQEETINDFLCLL